MLEVCILTHPSYSYHHVTLRTDVKWLLNHAIKLARW